MCGFDSSQPSVREFLAALPVECIGPNRLLSRALYRTLYDGLHGETVRAVYQLGDRYGREATFEHLLILPQDAYRWILVSFSQILHEQADSPSDDLIQGCIYEGWDGTGGYGEMLLAPKTWAADLLRDALQRRPLPPQDEITRA